MPLKQKKWEDVPERDRRNNYYSQEAFEDFEREMAETAERLKKQMSPPEFARWLEGNGREWVD